MIKHNRTVSTEPASATRRIINCLYPELSLVSAFCLTVISRSYSTHPGLHVALAVLLLDAVIWKSFGIAWGPRIAWVILINLLGLAVIKYAPTDAVEMTYSTFILLLVCLTVIVRPNRVYSEYN